MHPQKIPIRPVYNNQTIINETIQTSTNVKDIIGKILTINYHQFIVEDILGQGAFAFVFLVRSLFNQQRCALKRMYVNNQRDLHICQHEISLVKEFSLHRNIIKYVDSYIHRLPSTNLRKHDDDDDDDDTIYEIFLLTEYCSNGALITRLNEQRNNGISLNERQILRIFADICHAVSACHFRRPQPILHRDIKLENILIDCHQNYILCDFGSAIILPYSTTNNYQQYQTNQLPMNIIKQLEEDIQRYTTLSYRAPEIINLYNCLPITLKVDIWAMGCLLYKLMYNIMPFGESILAIQNGIFVIPDDMSQIYSRELNLFVRYILEIDINKRPDIWQVSYITYKLLGIECPISNQFQSKIPDLNQISMPLTDSESRHQRRNASSKTKSTSKNVNDESLSPGTTVKPRERPRGMIPSTSLSNFNQTNQQSSTIVVPPPPSLNSSQSGSSPQLKFDDDFSKTSLNNISTGTTINTNEQIVSRARPSPPATISVTSGLALKQQLLPPPPPSSSSHRRSTSQTISPTNIQSSFQNASSVDLSPQDEKKKSQVSITCKSTIRRYPTTEEAEKIISNNNLENCFDQLVNEDSDDEQEIDSTKKSLNEHNNQTNSCFIDHNNPFLRAPFHHSPANKQISGSSSTNIDRTITTANLSSFDPNNIVIGKRTSAFTPYQKQEINSDNYVMNTTNNSGTSITRFPHSETFPPSKQSSSSTDVFTNAPFKTKSKTKQHSTTINTVSSNQCPNHNRKKLINDIEPEQHSYSNLSIKDTIIDEYF